MVHAFILNPASTSGRITFNKFRLIYVALTELLFACKALGYYSYN